MEQERIWALLSRKLINEAIDAEIAELDMLLRKYPQFFQPVNQITENWQHSIPTDPEFMEATYFIHLERMKASGTALVVSENENSIPIINSVMHSKKIKKNFTYLFLSCIIIGLLFIFSMTSIKHPVTASNTNSNKTEIVTGNGTRTKMQLPDGSTVWLNAGSKVIYNKNLSGPNREVFLEGEAYFDVTKQPTRPFIVHTGNINIRVLGTAFNVKSYSSDKTIETTLLRGLIEITNQNDINSKAIFLHPNQKITIEKNNIASGLNSSKINSEATSYAVSKIDITTQKELPETAWMFNRLTFEGDSFEKLAQKFERWYDVKIIFEDDAVKQLHFNGALENETVEQAFEALQMANPFIYKINNHEIYVSSIPH